MPATTSDLLLNSLPSVNTTPKSSSRQTGGASFSEHWAAQSELGQQAQSPKNSAVREPDYSRGRANDDSRDNRHAANSSRDIDQSRNRSENRQDISPSRRDSEGAENRREEPAQARPDGAKERPEKLSRSEKAEHKPEGEAATQGEAKTETQSSEVPLTAGEAEYSNISSEEKFILALIGVSVPEPAAESDALINEDLPSVEGLDLDSESMLFSDENSNVELDTEALAAVEVPDGREVAGVGQAEESTIDDSVLLQSTAPTMLKASEASNAKVIDAELAGKIASINRQNQGTSILQELSSNPSEESGDELAAEVGLTAVSDPKLKMASAELAPISKLATNQLFKEVSSAPSASAYGESTGVNHSQSLGRASGLEHSFQLQRGADVQGRSTMQSDIGQPQWKAEIAEKVAWFSARNISKAEIRLDPPELGSLQIKIQLNQEQAQVSFNSPHASVREALDQSSSRLREMFQEQGLNLADVNVGGEGAQQHSDDAPGGSHAAFDEDLTETEVVHQPLRQSLSLVDSYV